MESRKRKKRGRARPHRLLRVTSLLRDRADLWLFVPPAAVLARPLRFTRRANLAARADDTQLTIQDGSDSVPDRFAGLEELRPLELRASAAGESLEDKRLCASLTVNHDHPELRIPSRGLSFPVYST